MMFRETHRKCNGCGHTNSAKLRKCHNCGQSLRGFKTNFTASAVKKQIVRDESKGSAGLWQCRNCNELNRNGNHNCHQCGENMHFKPQSKGFFSRVGDSINNQSRQQMGYTPNEGIKSAGEQIQNAAADKAAQLLVKGLSKLFGKK
jgi:ribosomal protein L34E